MSLVEPDPLTNLPIHLLAKIGSILVHVDEYLSDKGHSVDKAAIQSLLDDWDVQQWLDTMRGLGLLPEKR